MMDEPAATAVMRNSTANFPFDRYESITKVEAPTFNPKIDPEFAESSYLFFDQDLQQGARPERHLPLDVGLRGAEHGAAFTVGTSPRPPAATPSATWEATAPATSSSSPS